MSTWKHKTVLITGADGFIGSQLTKELVKRDARVVGVTRHKKSSARSYLSLLGLTDKVHLVIGDILDFHLMTDILSSYEVDYVFHLAAQSIVQTSSMSPFNTLDNNVRGTYTLLDACRSLGAKTIKGIVVASSDKAYGAHDKLPYLESYPLNALNIYESSKACTDKLAVSYAHNFNMPVSVTRCCNVIGFDLNLTRLIPRTILKIMRGEKPVIYSGVSGYTREFMHSDDAVDAYLTVAANMNKTAGKAYNISSGNIISIEDTVKKIESLMKSDLGYEVIEKTISNFNEIPHQYLSGELIAKDLNWKRKIGMDEMFSKCIEDYSKYRSNLI